MHATSALASSFIHAVGCGMPAERQARIAARRAFVDMKQGFMAAVASLGGAHGHWLREQVRSSADPVDLWLLREDVLAALPEADNDSRRMCLDLHRALDQAFSDGLPLRPAGA